jgi:phosphoribosyl 1,2-cyclic phosphodiesterase
VSSPDAPQVTVTFAGSGDAFGSGGRYQACIHLRGPCGAAAWTDALIDVAAGADLLIAEAYYRDKNVPYHLRHADLAAHADRLACRRIVLTHMSADMLARRDQARFETASDGLVLRI